MGHVEAGLRTYNKWSPFPEEMNRQLTGRLADMHFAPTERARQNLLQEGVETSNIVVTGNTVIDALYQSVNIVNRDEYTNGEIENLKSILDFHKDFVLVTGHRRENFGQGFVDICHALKEIAQRRTDIQIIYPVHLNPNVQQPVNEILTGVPNINLIPPLNYPSFVWAMDKARIIITDSGGYRRRLRLWGSRYWLCVIRQSARRLWKLVLLFWSVQIERKL